MSNQSRRDALKNLVAGTAALGTANMLTSFSSNEEIKSHTLKGNINHSVCRWCYNQVPLEEFCAAVKKMGIGAIDLVGPKEWPVLQKYGIFSSMCNGAELNLVDGWNDKKFHPQLIKNYSDMIPLVAKAGYKQLICFSGSRRGIDDETGWNNCAEGLKQIIGLAEKNNVQIVMELLNSKVNHKDYQFDHISWGAEVMKRVDSPRVKILYDIYHAQIMDGDIVRSIRDNIQYIAHFHTGGNPGRNDIDETQELNYGYVMREIAALGFNGFVTHEYTPAQGHDPIQTLDKAMRICDV